MSARTLVFAALFFALTIGQTGAATLVVSTCDDRVNGDTSSPAALIANPGPDGISLREALLAVGNAPGPNTIAFARKLAGCRIAPTSLLPAISRDRITLTGLTDAQGQPAITIDGSQLPPGPVLFVAASSFTMTGLAFPFVPNNFSVVQIGGWNAAFAAGARLVANIRIAGNSFSNPSMTGDGFAIQIGGYGSDNNNTTVKNVTITGNTFSMLFEAIKIGGGNSGGTLTEDVSVTGNAFSNIYAFAGVEPGNCCGANNIIRQVRIFGNSFTNSAQGVYLNNGNGSTGSVIEEVRIARNIFSGSSPDIGITAGDGAGDVGNAISDVLIDDNVIAGTATLPAAAGIFISDNGSGASDNTIADLSIVNNTIVGPLEYGSVSVVSSGGVSGVAVLNTIFAGNSGNDLQGVAPAQVSYSITSQSGFAGTNQNLNVDPLFVNAAAGDFHLQAGSPAAGAGSFAGAPAKDLDCQKRPDPPSVGAYEPGSTNICRISPP